MCGIVGYIGHKAAQDILLEGLSRLEYRGYDSAGVAIYDGQDVNVQKTMGKLYKLEEVLENNPLSGSSGIGHTRWATHGKPSNINAHPHTCNDDKVSFSVVHNGIIENYIEFKNDLINQGVTFNTETDSEVIAKLLVAHWTGDFLETVRIVVDKLKGAYALGIICKEIPDKIIAVRKYCPLIIGIGEDENFIASDIAAILHRTRKMIVLEDNDIAVLERGNVTVTSPDGQVQNREIVHVDWTLDVAEKDGYEHFMLKEIFEQPTAIKNTLARNKAQNFQEMTLDIAKVDRVHFVACGTAYHAGLVGKYVFEELLRIPVECEVASEYRYRNPIITDKTLVIGVSQSGETADTLAAVREAKRRGAHVLAITNVIGSSIVREADDVVATWAGPEIAVASTKAYTAQLSVIYALAIEFARQLGSYDLQKLDEFAQSLEQASDNIENILAQSSVMKILGDSLAKHQTLFFLGRGLDYFTALEGSLKLKEITYIHSEAYPAGELKHGTLALIEEGTIVLALATQSAVYEKMLSNIEEVKARGARVIAFTSEQHTDLAGLVDEVIVIPSTSSFLMPLLTIIPLQLLSYYTCLQLGFDADKPRNLAKSVTVE